MVINVHNAMRKTKKASKRQLTLLKPGIPCLLQLTSSLYKEMAS